MCSSPSVPTPPPPPPAPAPAPTPPAPPAMPPAPPTMPPPPTPAPMPEMVQADPSENPTLKKKKGKRKQLQQANRGPSAMSIPLNTAGAGAAGAATGGLNIPK